MSFVIAAAGVSVAPAIFKGIQGINQTNAAKRINPINPGYQMNSGVIDNARILGERANNYQMPGYMQAKQNIEGGAVNSFNAGVQGASSGGDVLDLATKLAFGKNNSLNTLATQSAMGAIQAQDKSLSANAQAGQEYVNKNIYDRGMYDRTLAEKAALTEAGMANTAAMVDGIGQVGGAALGGMVTPKAGTVASLKLQPSIYTLT